MRGLRTLLLPALLCFPPLLNAQPDSGAVQVQVSGEVRRAGTIQISKGGRLADVLHVAQPTAEAYLLGASLQREPEREAQMRQRAGLQYILQQLPGHEDEDVRRVGVQLDTWLRAHPATGRLRLMLERRLMQAQPLANPPAGSGDRILIPRRPQTVHLIGALQAPCELPHDPLMDAPEYLAQCPVSAAADADTLYVVQPDGLVQTLGVAAWNRADPQAVAAGGTIYVPIRQSALEELDTAFNEEFASFVATQPVEP